MKGVRTRFFYVLEKAVQLGVSLLDTNLENISSQECKSVRQQVSECKWKLNTYTEKLSCQSEKLAQAIGDSDDELTEKIMEDDFKLSEQAVSVLYILQLLEEVREIEKTTAYKFKDPVVHESDENGVQTMCELQSKLQQEFFEKQEERSELQMKTQQDFLEKQNVQTKTTLKLPKIDLIGFSGNRLQWIEF